MLKAIKSLLNGKNGKTTKLIGYLWENHNWNKINLPKCSDGSIKHDIYHYHIGWYGPFEEVVGSCRNCKHCFKGTAEQFRQNVKERGDEELFKKAFPEGIGGVDL